MKNSVPSKTVRRKRVIKTISDKQNRGSLPKKD